MTRIRYTTPARSQGEPHMRRGSAELVEKDVHRWAFVYGTDGFHCDLRVVRIPRFTGPTRVGTHVVPDDAPPLHAIARTDEAVGVDARDSNPRDAVKAIVEATGPSPRLSVCGRPFCLNDADGVNDAEGV